MNPGDAVRLLCSPYCYMNSRGLDGYLLLVSITGGSIATVLCEDNIERCVYLDDLEPGERS